MDRNSCHHNSATNRLDVKTKVGKIYIIFKLGFLINIKFFLFYRVQLIQDSGDIFFAEIDKIPIKKKLNQRTNQVTVTDIAILLSYKMGLTCQPTPCRNSLVDEIELFLKLGDFYAMDGDNDEDLFLCYNPTVLTVDGKLWLVKTHINNQCINYCNI